MNIPKLLGWRDKDFQLGDGKQTAKFIADKLKEGWVILTGDIETIEMIERTVFTPGTDRNKGFALVMGKILPDDETITTLFLARKTDLFKERIMYHCGISEEIYDKLIIINIMPSEYGEDGEDSGVIWDYTMMEKDVKDDDSALNSFVEHIVKDILKMEE